MWVNEYWDEHGVVLLLYWAILRISLECNRDHVNKHLKFDGLKIFYSKRFAYIHLIEMCWIF